MSSLAWIRPLVRAETTYKELRSIPHCSRTWNTASRAPRVHFLIHSMRSCRAAHLPLVPSLSGTISYLPSKWDRFENINEEPAEEVFWMSSTHGPVFLSDHLLRSFSVSPKSTWINIQNTSERSKRNLQWYCNRFVSPQVMWAQWTLFMYDFLIVAHYKGKDANKLIDYQNSRLWGSTNRDTYCTNRKHWAWAFGTPPHLTILGIMDPSCPKKCLESQH